MRIITFLLAAAAYVCWQAAHILFPQNVYETALPITISDTIEADGVLLFDETCISGSGNLGYLVSDGERVSAGTAVAELYTDANQAVPNAGEARTLARRRVADMGGNGVSFDKCAEFSDVPGCLKQVICYGQALKVAEEK